MAVSVQVPNLGEAMAGGVVAEWYRADGALVGLGELVCRVESSFVAVELEAEGEGTLRHQKPAGSIERPGAVLGVILSAGEAMPSVGTAPAPPAEAGEDEDHGEFADSGFEDETERLAVALVEDDSQRFAQAVAEDEPELAAPGDEFEEALREAVVVPFPRRFTGQAPRPWEEAPGDAIEFATALWDEPAPEQTAELPEPGGSIPGLPLWETEEAPQGRPVLAAARFERIATEVAADAQVLWASISVATAEAMRLRAACAKEWSGGPSPLVEDVLFRAVAFALRDGGHIDSAAAIVVAEADADVASGIASPAGRPLREAVAARSSGTDSPVEQAAWVLVSLAALGVASCTPRLEHGRRLSFAVGAPDASGHATLTMAFDSLAWSEGSAARLLARIRELFEAPYAMLV